MMKDELMPEARSVPRSSLGAVVVTGVSSGIGKAIALDLIHAGYTVFGSVRREADAASLCQIANEQFIPLIFDVTDAEGIARAVAEVELRLGNAGLVALVNNAGISISGPFLYQPANEFQKVFDVNFHGLVNVTRAFLPLLGACDQPKGPPGRPKPAPGRIVNIGSVQGALTVPFMSAYSASKHAVEAFAQGLRRELIPFGISVSTIEPNFTRSEIFAKAAADSSDNRYQGTGYEAAWAQFNASLAAQEANAKPAETVTRKVLHAIQSPRPRTRYPLDPIWHIGRILPDRMFDGLIFKALGLARLMAPQGTKSHSGSTT